MHRLVTPVNLRSSEVVYIMWTSTHSSMPAQHWQPNHFVPVVPLHSMDSLLHVANEVEPTPAVVDSILDLPDKDMLLLLDSPKLNKEELGTYLIERFVLF